VFWKFLKKIDHGSQDENNTFVSGFSFCSTQTEKKHFLSFCAISFPQLQVRQKCICGRETSPRTAAAGELTASTAACKRRFAAKEKGAEEGREHGRSLNLVHGG